MGRIAPHENKEVMMVLNGSKPFATIERDKDLAGYCLAVQLGGAGLLAVEVGPTADCCDGEIQLCKPGNRQYIDEYNYLVGSGVEDLGLKPYHRRMGKLFGYQEEDVEKFINANINCNCTKCGG